MRPVSANNQYKAPSSARKAPGASRLSLAVAHFKGIRAPVTSPSQTAQYPIRGNLALDPHNSCVHLQILRCSPRSGAIPKCLVHSVGGRFSVWRQDMSIDVCRHSDGGVSQYFAYHLQFDAAREHQAGRRVTQLVGVPVLEAHPLADCREFAIEISWINRSTKIRGENESRVSPELVHNVALFLLAIAVLHEQLHQSSRKVHRSPAPRGLCIGGNE